MTLLKYFKLKQSNRSFEYLLDVNGPLTIKMPNGSITAFNSSVAKMLEKQQTQAETNNSCGQY